MSEHGTERDHPIDGYLFAIVLAIAIGAVFWIFIGSNWAYLGIMVAVFGAWGLVSLAIFGRDRAGSGS